MTKFSKVEKTRRINSFGFGRLKATSMATTIFAGLLGSSAVAQTCSVSPDFVNWVTPGTTGWTTDSQSGNITWGSASTDIAINGPFFIGGGETSIIRITEYDFGRGKYTFDFRSPVVHDVKLFLGNLGRTSVTPLDSAVIGDFNFGISDGTTAANLFGTINGKEYAAEHQEGKLFHELF